MARLLLGDPDPVVEERARQVGRAEPGDQVPRKIDGVELDMGERVQKGDAARQAGPRFALGHLRGRQEEGPRRPGRAVGRIRLARRQGAGAPGRGRITAAARLRRRIGCRQDPDRCRAKAVRGRQTAFAAASTSSTWPGTLTLRQMLRMTPFGSIRKVERSMPMYLRPYMLFSTQVP